MGPTGCTLQHALREAHPGWIWTLLVGPASDVLYSGSGDKTIRVWALPAAGGGGGGGGLAASPPALCHVVQGHEDAVCSLVASRDGAFLYSGSDDRCGDWGRGVRTEPGAG